MCLSMKMVMCNKQYLIATCEPDFMKKLSKTKVELKKSVAYKCVCRKT